MCRTVGVYTEARVIPTPEATRFLPRRDRRTAGPGESTPGLPADLLRQSANRVRILALLYAGVFFMAGFFPALLFEADRTLLFSKFTLWGPGTIAIVVALLVAAVMRSPRVPLTVAMSIALVFEVASCYGIATAEFLDPAAIDVNVRWFGLSWVAPWTLLLSIGPSASAA